MMTLEGGGFDNTLMMHLPDIISAYMNEDVELASLPISTIWDYS